MLAGHKIHLMLGEGGGHQQRVVIGGVVGNDHGGTGQGIGFGFIAQPQTEITGDRPVDQAPDKAVPFVFVHSTSRGECHLSANAILHEKPFLHKSMS